ncbi:phosphotransferase family protein [Mycolicibacterium sp. A43C]
MALTNSLTPAYAQQRLAAWFDSHDELSNVFVSDVTVPSANGLSNETLLFDVEWTRGGVQEKRSLVARVQPVGEGLSPRYDVEWESRLLCTLSKTATPVPAVLFYESDTSWLGAPFAIVQRLPGRPVEDSPCYLVAGRIFDLAPDERAQVAERAIAQIAKISTLDWRELGLDFVARPGGSGSALQRELQYFEDWLAWARDADGDNPVVDAAVDWVEAHMPEDEDIVLSWGDSRMGNLLFDDELRVSGVLDWEFASLGSPELDLGWWLFIERHFIEPAGLSLPEGWPNRDQTIAIWERHSGRTAKHIDFHEVFAGLRFTVMMVRAAQLVKAAGIIPPDSTMAQNNPGTQVLARLIGVPVPEGIGSHVV